MNLREEDVEEVEVEEEELIDELFKEKFVSFDEVFVDILCLVLFLIKDVINGFSGFDGW